MVKNKRGGSDNRTGQPAGEAAGEPKLSTIIHDMGASLLKAPAAGCSLEAAETMVLLASCAWNAALGDWELLDRLPEMLGRIDFSARQPWPEMVSSDIGLLISDLLAFKQAHHPGDRRRIVIGQIHTDGRLQISWTSGAPPLAGPFGPRVSRSFVPGRPVASKILARLARTQRREALDLSKIRASQAGARDLQESVVTRKELAKLHPVHAAYVLAQNQASLLAEQIAALPELKPIAKLLERAEDIYMPSGPPMSPITVSFYTCWALFDLCPGPAEETIGTTILEVGAALKMGLEMLRLFARLQESRMGVYILEDSSASTVQLRELVTGRSCRAVVPEWFRGRKGELWYVRVLPPPFPGGREHLVFTTPYILAHPGLDAWEAYFRRVLPDAPSQARLEAYERHMKYGPDPWYWSEFVFEAYLNYSSAYMLLTGLPDLPQSRPHSAVNRERGGA